MFSEISKNVKTGYNEIERKFMMAEFRALANARQEKYSDETLREWVKSFWEMVMSANEVCRRIRSVKESTVVYGKIAFSHFVDADIENVQDIIKSSELTKKEMFDALLTCKICGRVITIKRRQIPFQSDSLKICEHRVVSIDQLRDIYEDIDVNLKIIEF